MRLIYIRSLFPLLMLGVFSQTWAAPVSGQGTWETTLIPRDLDGNSATAEAYYDTKLDITWLADANFAFTSGYDLDGLMTWADANAWAASLVLGGESDWRLPDADDSGMDGCDFGYNGTDCGYNVDDSTSEMAHLFYVTLGNIAYYDTAGNPAQPGWGLTNTALFQNIGIDSRYWSATQPNLEPLMAWEFVFQNGRKDDSLTTQEFYAWAVHDGMIGKSVSAVPLPAAGWLLLSGIGGLAFFRKRKI